MVGMLRTGMSISPARRALRTVAGVASVLCLGLLLTGCGGVTTAAPPLAVCGQTISNLPAGAILQDVSRGGTVLHGSAGGYIYLRVSESCDNGATVRWEPMTAAQKITVAKASDGRLAAVVLRPLRRTFTVLLHSRDAGPVRVRVDLPPAPSPETQRSHRHPATPS